MKLCELNERPIVGQHYWVPCVYGIASGRSGNVHEWWPVLLPSHQDSEFIPREKMVWEKTDIGSKLVKEIYFENDENAPKHYHVDARFTPEHYYDYTEKRFHASIGAEGVLERDKEMRYMLCQREMPQQSLFTVFGKKFVEKHEGKKAKCGRCPHRGIDLTHMPEKNGIVTCPAHGLRFFSHNMQCTFVEGE